MKIGKHHCEIDEITYNRAELVEFYNQHKQHLMGFSDYMHETTPDQPKRQFGYNAEHGMCAVAVHLTEGKQLLDYDVVNKYVNRFNFDVEIDPKDMDMLYYRPGFEFHPHTDRAMQCGIMFPIIPHDAGEPIMFYKHDGINVAPSTDYEHLTNKDIDYKHYYSTVHPTLFNGHAIHGVPEIQNERVLLRIKVLGESFESIMDKLRNNNFILTS